jgi:1,4-dihydroxy-2-naphthoate octaprenyltransferase
MERLKYNSYIYMNNERRAYNTLVNNNTTNRKNTVVTKKQIIVIMLTIIAALLILIGASENTIPSWFLITVGVFTFLGAMLYQFRF